jgi:hypothetical protein
MKRQEDEEAGGLGGRWMNKHNISRQEDEEAGG